MCLQLIRSEYHALYFACRAPVERNVLQIHIINCRMLYLYLEAIIFLFTKKYLRDSFSYKFMKFTYKNQLKLKLQQKR